MAHATVLHEEALADALRASEESARTASENQRRAFEAEMSQVLARAVTAQGPGGEIDFSTLSSTSGAGASARQMVEDLYVS